ncbi:hypothetical protein RJ640_021793 [Escallonia rubra]|uniref:SMP-LTD domain-containing protein n=1 Tax=Escallonia rubra TaxID=112253 RepID=A0AA88USY5_9ASTE|nr:hypothetical protein RJ640_021793 [Escallonia rubra]
MGFLSSLVGILGFGIGISVGLIIGFYFFIYSEPEDVEDPVVRPLYELDTTTLLDLMPEIPFWVKNPDYDRVDWLNKFMLHLWPYLDKAVCDTIRTTAEPIFGEYIGKFQIEAIKFENLSLGTLPPTVHGELTSSQLVHALVFLLLVLVELENLLVVNFRILERVDCI